MSKTVLIVEDDFVVALDHQLSVEDTGWKVLGPVADVQAALSVLQVERPTVALLDLYLGEELVTPVAEVLKEKGIPFVMCSATDRLDVVGGEVFAGVVNIGKPFKPDYLQKVLEDILS